MEKDPTKWTGSIVTLIEAFLMLAISIGWFDVTDAQVQLIINVCVALIAVGAPVWGFLYTRNKSTALYSPKDVDGAPLLRVDGTPPMRVAEIRKNAA